LLRDLFGEESILTSSLLSKGLVFAVIYEFLPFNGLNGPVLPEIIFYP